MTPLMKSWLVFCYIRMCVCVCVCVCVSVYMCIQCLDALRAKVNVCVHVYIGCMMPLMKGWNRILLYMCVCMCIYVYMYMSVHVYKLRVCVYMYMYMYMYMYIYVYVYVHVYMYMYIKHVCITYMCICI